MGHKYHWLRHPRTTQEKRANQGRGRKPDLVRPARHARRLPHAWDDIFIHYSKCWKDDRKRDKQYYPVEINGQVKTYSKPSQRLL